MWGLEYWADDNFIIEDSSLKINYKSKPSLLEITNDIKTQGIRGPLLLRFPHLLKKQISTMYKSFNRAINENSYSGNFSAVYPLKVNQFPSFLDALQKQSNQYNYGLEAGSKAELTLSLSLNKIGAPIMVNGFKDREMIALGYLCAKLGHDITLTIEGLEELHAIIEISKKFPNISPKIGIRTRLHSAGSGIWEKSGGINSKFGLSATELIEALELLKTNNLVKQFTILHFHIGSQISDIAPMKKALREAGNIYASLIQMGASSLSAINLGGGLAIEYAQHENKLHKNYSLREFANDVIFVLGAISKAKGVKEPHIVTESGRFIAASHAVLIAPVLELFTHEYNEKSLRLKEVNPPLIEELQALYNSINEKSALEYLHDALEHKESLLSLFDLGYIDLVDRSNAEILVHQIINKSLTLVQENQTPELKKLQNRMQERYLINASIFQSLPDFWGLGQKFPIVPLNKLDKKPSRAATLWDITCDSDGEIEFNNDAPLYLHDVDLEKDDYFLAFFLVGAYQEVLSMRHNLFSAPTEAIIEIDDNGYKISELTEAASVLDILDDIGYDRSTLLQEFQKKIFESNDIEDKDDTLSLLLTYLNQNAYLRTTE